MPRGSRPGERRGGRKKGTPNRDTAALQEAVAASCETPLEYMLRVIRDPTVNPLRRDNMAAKAAPYIHSQLKSIEHKGVGEVRRPAELTDADIDRRIAELEQTGLTLANKKTIIR
jgi:hypothetical protein